MLYSYVPSLVKCSVFGVELKGLSKDTIVTIERIDGATTFRKAQDGSQTAFYDTNGSYRVTLNIEQVSESNEFLHIVYKLHRKSGLNVKIPLSITEKTGSNGTTFTSYDTFFELEPNAEFGSESGSRQWVFVCNNASYALRGTTGDAGFITAGLRATIRLIEMAQVLGVDMSNVENLIDKGINEAQQRLKNLF